MNRGLSLIEVVITAALILSLSVAFTGAYISGESSIEIAGQRIRANLLAEEGLEAARSLRDTAFSNLVNGTYGVSQTSSAWVLSGSSDTKDIFTRKVTVSTIDTVTKQVASTVIWPENGTRSGSVTQTTYLTNTQLLSPQANKLMVSVAGAGLINLSTRLQGITIQNIGSSPIVISKITVSWSTSVLNHLTALKINGVTAWSSTGPGSPSGVQNTGTPLTLQSVTVPANSAVLPIDYFQFDGTMLLNTYTITFTMADGSTKTVSTLQI